MAAYQAAIADGTVFRDLRDETETIVDIAGTNDALRTRLQGSGYAGNKAAGRAELAATYGIRDDLARRLANNEHIDDWEWDNAVVEGARGASNMQLGNEKTVGMQLITSAMSRETARHQAIAADPSATTAHVQASQERVQEIVAKAQNMQDVGIYMPEFATSVIASGQTSSTEVALPHAAGDVSGQGVINLEHVQTARADLEGRNAEMIRQRQEAHRLQQQVNEARQQANERRRLATAAVDAAETARLEAEARHLEAEATRGNTLAQHARDESARIEQEIQTYLRNRQTGRIDPRAPGGPADPMAPPPTPPPPGP
jgi:hypothetical protein